MSFHLIARTPMFAVALCLAAAAASPSAAPERPGAPPEPAGMALPFRTAIFESSMRLNGSPTGTQAKIWYSPSGTFEELVTPEGTSCLLRGGRYSYGWIKGHKTGFKTLLGGSTSSAGLPDALDVIRETGFDLLPSNSRFVAVEVIEGRRVRHYDFHWQDHFQKALREGSIWVLEDRLFPVRFVNTGTGGRFEIVNSNFRFDVDIPKELFEPPKDVRFSEFEGGMRGRSGGSGGGGAVPPGFPGPLPKKPASPLPDGAFRVEWKSADVPAHLRRSETKDISVTFRNAGTVPWPDPSSADPDHPSGPYAVRLCSRWTRAGEQAKLEDYKTRTDLSQPLEPGQSATLVVTVTAPSEPGRYELQFDLVQELVTYFERKGGARLVRTVEVR